MKNYVTGAGGMVGSHMVEFLHANGEQVIGSYYKPTVDIKTINHDIQLVETDVRYPENVERIIIDFRPDRIFHLAAQSYPTVSWEKPYETMEININGTIAVYEAIKKVRKHFDESYDPIVVVACSSAEYGQTLNELDGDCKVKENAELKPLHPYGVSKVGQDLISYQYFMNDHIRCIRARIFNTTGTRKVNDVTSDFTKRAIECERTGTYKLRVGNIHTKRAIMDQDDLVHGLYMLADKGVAGEVYNISSRYVYEICDVIDMIEKDMGVKFELEVDPSLLRPTDEKIIVGDITKITHDTGWQQEIPMSQTIHSMLEYWRKYMV